VGFLEGEQSLFSLEFSSFLNGSPFGLLVHLGFGGDQGPCTAQNILVSDANDASFFLLENLKILMTRFESAWFASSPQEHGGLE